MPFDNNRPTTVDQLMYIRAILARPEKWCQHQARDGDAHSIAGATWAAGVDTSPFRRFRGPNMTYPGHLKRGQIPEACWFLRQALRKLDPNSDGLIYKWNDAPERTHAEVLELLDLAIELVLADMKDSAVIEQLGRGAHALVH